MIATCTNCQEEFTIEIIGRKTAERGVREHGFACPFCNHWTRTHYSSRETRRLTARAQEAMKKNQRLPTDENFKGYRDAKLKLNEAHDALQERMSEASP